MKTYNELRDVANREEDTDMKIYNELTSLANREEDLQVWFSIYSWAILHQLMESYPRVIIGKSNDGCCATVYTDLVCSVTKWHKTVEGAIILVNEIVGDLS